MVKVLIPIAHGCEELEAVTLIDLWVRAGAQVTVASCNANGALSCVMSRGVTLVADVVIEDLTSERFDLIALPGGMPGAQHLSQSRGLVTMLKQQRNEGRWLAAICAAPVVVLLANDLLGKQATCHPAFQGQLPESVRRESSPVVVDHEAKLVTSQGPGTALEFTLTLIELLLGKAARQQVADPLILVDSIKPPNRR